MALYVEGERLVRRCVVFGAYQRDCKALIGLIGPFLGHVERLELIDLDAQLC